MFVDVLLRNEPDERTRTRRRALPRSRPLDTNQSGAAVLPSMKVLAWLMSASLLAA